MAPAVSPESAAITGDAGVRATAITRIIALAGAPVTVYLAAAQLAPERQGLYFVAVNILAVAQLFEIGLGSTVVQFVSHDNTAFQSRASGGPGSAAPDGPSRELASVVWRWYAASAIALLLVVGAGGLWLFRNRTGLVSAEFAPGWLVFAALIAGYVACVPAIATAEGAGHLISVQRMRSWQAVAILVALWTGLLMGNPLLAALLASLAQLLVTAVWRRARRVPTDRRTDSGSGSRILDHVANTQRVDVDVRVRFRTEQRRSAAFWLALWAGPQLLTPIALRAAGGDAAGRLGVTLAIALAPLTLGAAWLHGRYPSFGTLVAAGHVREFDALARRATAGAIGAFLLLSCAAVGVVTLLPGFLPALAARVLPLPSLIALLVGALVSLLVQAMAGWLRAFRDEGIATPVVIGAVATVLASATAGAAGNVELIAAAYAAASGGIALPVAAWHFLRTRRERLAGETARS